MFVFIIPFDSNINHQWILGREHKMKINKILRNICFFAMMACFQDANLCIGQIRNDTIHIINPLNGIEYAVYGKDTFAVVDKYPEFPGGQQKLYKYISDNLTYPESALKDNIHGKVLVAFTVDKYGKINDINIMQGVREDINKAAVELVSKMPVWIPGYQKNTPIPVRLLLPLNFKSKETVNPEFQSISFDSLLVLGKAAFYKANDSGNYSRAIDILEKSVALRPENTEAHYFLGYAYCRLNAEDGNGMIDSKLSLTIKSSEQFELVNKISPKYTGEIIVVDPYSKLTGEWGSLAMSYLFKNMKDSAVWAFGEGKKRGGFGEFYLSINRKALDLCSHNAILISSGDNFTIPLWYLQTVENYRTDVTVIDISLLNTIWYPNFLISHSNISFGLTKEELDSIKYCSWAEHQVNIPINKKHIFSWTVKPSFYEKYLLRGDHLFLKLLKENKFQRDIFFTFAFDEKSKLSLQNKLNSLILIDRINYDQKSAIKYKKYKSILMTILESLKYLNMNSQEELNLIDNIRLTVFSRISYYLQIEDKRHAKKLMNLVDKYLSDKKYSFQFKVCSKYYENLKKILK
jgi:TonB family protein